MKKLILLVLSFLLIQGCSENLTESLPEVIYGLEGVVLDTAGIPISGVQIYCLFDYGFLPDTTGNSLYKDMVLADSSFGNELHQNFPNPLSKDTYIRFSIRKQSIVDLSISSKLDGKVIYQNRDTLPYGFYQRFLGDLGRGKDIKNGPCEAVLNITTPDDSFITLKKELFIITDKNKANSVSSNEGHYIFNYKESFIDDTIKECFYYEPDEIYNHIIYNSIVLLFKKEGYVTKYVYVTLYPGIKLNQDVIMKKEEGQ